MMNNEERGKRKICMKCQGFGGKLVFRQGEGLGFSNFPKLVKEDCPDCWGRGYLEPTTSDVPWNEQGAKYFMYP